jgi:hypothetical protein
MAGVLPVAYWLMRRQNALAIAGSGLLLGLLGIAVQAGWLSAVGFRPGIYWRPAWAAGAAALLVVGMVASLWVAFSGSAERRRNVMWRLGAGLMMGLSLIAGQEALLAGAGLTAQVGSVFKDEVPASVMCLVGGVLAPLVMSVMALDLELRRGLDKRGKGDIAPPKRRRRKQRIRHL